MIKKSKMRFAFHFPSWPLESHSFGLKYEHFRYQQLQKCPNSKNYFVKAHYCCDKFTMIYHLYLEYTMNSLSISWNSPWIYYFRHLLHNDKVMITSWLLITWWLLIVEVTHMQWVVDYESYATNISFFQNDLFEFLNTIWQQFFSWGLVGPNIV